MRRPLIIAEVKTKSPFGFQSEKSWDELFKVADEHGDWLSIHTNELWGGSFDLIKRAKSLTNKPVLAKGIHETDDLIERALESGADYVLTVREEPPEAHRDLVLFEPFSVGQLGRAYGLGVKAVWNARDLRAKTAADIQKTETFDEARSVFPRPGWLCQASLIETIVDVHAGADAVLVGQSLEKFVASL